MPRVDLVCRLSTAGLLRPWLLQGGHPIGASIALKALRIYEEMNSPAHVRKLSAELAARLAKVANLEAVGDVPVIGLMAE
ncbi:hypothetical protein ACVDG5_036695 [Mesorhizobium sp. ORM6]